MAVKKPGLVTTVSIITRRLKEGKTYEDFRKAWFHTTGFSPAGEETVGSSNRMYSMIDIFDPREIVVMGIDTTTLGQLEAALAIDVKYRGENPLDAVIEPAIGRKFCIMVAEDDFSAAGDIPYTPPSVGGRQTDLAEFDRDLHAVRELFAAAAEQRDAANAARRQQSGPAR